MIVEVFKTNVRDPDQANMLVQSIHSAFAHYKVNFDLEDCDNILRVETSDAPIDSSRIMAMLSDLGFDVQVLPDDVPELLPF